MALTELLQCPECRSEIECVDGRPACPRCGYRMAGIPVEPPACRMTVFDPFAAVALEITKGYAILRSFMHVCVRRLVQPRGRVLDLGCGRAPSYRKHLHGESFQYVRADGNPEYKPDILVNLEAPLPIRDGAFDTVLLFNVLEHLYDYRAALAEIHRVLAPDGTLYLLVPFTIRIHGSPHDYFRYTHHALQRLLADAGFTDIHIYVCGGLLKLLGELFNWSSKFGIGYLCYPLYLLFCAIDHLLGIITRGKYQRTIPIGYFVSCKRG